MKRSLFICCLFAIILVTQSAFFMDDNGKAGVVNAPGETSCNTTNCHNSFVLNSGTGSVTATSTMNNWTYDPLTTYTITITVRGPGAPLFGLGVEVLKPSGANGGTLIITDVARTAIKSATIAGNSRRCVVHKKNAGLSNDSAVFSFNWTSPDTTAGVLTMYYAGNVTNNNGQPTGDHIYTLTHTITPSSGNSVDNVISADPVSVFPNPASDYISLHYSLPKSENVIVKLYDLNGRSVAVLDDNYHSAGENNATLSVPAGLGTGIYTIGIESESGRFFKKLFINN